MEWLSLWLKKIILLVLLAAFLDLVLPNTSLQRYVKMVMGLIILLTIMSPIFALFQLPQEEIAIRLSQYQAEFDQATQADWRPLAKRLMGQQEEQVNRYVEEQMEQTIRQQVKTTYGVEPESVDVQLDTTNPEEPAITRIAVVLGEGQQQESERAVRPIEPIRIEIGEPVTSAAANRQATQTNSRYDGMTGWLAGQWGVQPEQVVVTSIRDGEGSRTSF